MRCPHCGKTISVSDLGAGLGSVKSDAKAASSADNGRDWQKPHFRKIEHFLTTYPGLTSNEYKVKVKLKNGSTYNPDYYDHKSNTYIEIATSLGNIGEQREKWREAMDLINLRVFWWNGMEISEAIYDNYERSYFTHNLPLK